MTIHKEGRPLLLATAGIICIVTVIMYSFPIDQTIRYGVLGLCVIIFVLFLQFFRSPTVQVAPNDNVVLAPADGKVVVIEETLEGEYLNARRKQISIFMSPINVHVNRMPAGGSITFFKYHPGKYLVAWHPKSSTENERTTVVVKTKTNVEILFRQIAGAVARRIKWYIKEGDQLQQGDEFGFIKFGSRVDIFLPLSAKIQVEVGQKTKAGRTILAEL